MGISIDFLVIMDVHLSLAGLPYFFVVFQLLYFRHHHHGIDASEFLRLDWIADDGRSEEISLPERPWRDLDNQALRTV